MKSICFFCSYYTCTEIPNYVKFYLKELKRHFSEVILLTNEKDMPIEDIHFLALNNIPYKLYKNEGYDFGMWYKAFKEYDLKAYNRVGLVNDSCILFGKLDTFFQWMEEEQPDFCGYTDSYLIGYHLQSYFLVINKRAISLITEYFSIHGIKADINNVIKTYEIGLSKFLSDAGMKISAYYQIPLKGEYNYALLNAKDLIKKGFPLIKKKIITRLYSAERWWSMVVIGFDPFPSHYIKLIKAHYEVPDGMFEELTRSKGFMGSIKFNVVSVFAIVWGIFRNKRKMV
jgi:lipopolysaccharide biosynthesis protein